MAEPMIGHRSEAFSELYASLQPGLQDIFRTGNPVFLAASSATGIMELAIRNLVRRRCLCLVCGAFGERWHRIALANGKEAEALRVDWGKAIRAESVEERLRGGGFDAVTLVHNETSTGVLNPLEEIARAVGRFPETTFLVDTVSSLATVPIEVDRRGIDLCLAGVQKGLALPPGLTLFSVSPRALEKARTVKERGYYFDLLLFQEKHRVHQTPTTPPISLFYALREQLGRIAEEGLEKRYERHRHMAELCRDWARRRFKLFGEEGYLSPSLTCVENAMGLDLARFLRRLAERGVVLAPGYGKLRARTFRIGHMGDCTPEAISGLLDLMDEVIGS
jgi:aspartate aminotransferase-like enzyme